MCVICVSETGEHPTLDDLKLMQESNSDGIGIAWLVPTNPPKTRIEFERNIKVERLFELMEKAKRTKVPYVAHFRFATFGGKLGTLCHPFPVTNNQRLLFTKRGRYSYVLAHNGHWNVWEADISVPAKVNRIQEWSDSAALAYIAAQRQEIIIPPGHRIATLHWDVGLKLWGNWAKHDGYQTSNNGWMWRHRQFVAYGNYAAWAPYVYDSKSRMDDNKYPCVHGKCWRCWECPPTFNDLPIEVLPGLSPKEHFSHKDNGILKGAQWHACQHKGHFHCGECNLPACTIVKQQLEAKQAEAKACDPCKVEATRQSSRYRLPVHPDCQSPGVCQAYPCEQCKAFRVEVRKAEDAEVIVEVKHVSRGLDGDKPTALVVTSSTRKCKHGTGMHVVCEPCKREAAKEGWRPFNAIRQYFLF